jgi:hypothetical protein
MYKKQTNKRRVNKKRITRSKKGGFFGLFSRKAPIVDMTQCDPNNLPNLKSADELKLNYQQCCPKKLFGFKNRSPYCKQVDLNYQAALENEKMNEEYIDIEPQDVYTMKQQEENNMLPQPQVKLSGGKRKIKTQKKRHYKNKK